MTGVQTCALPISPILPAVDDSSASQPRKRKNLMPPPSNRPGLKPTVPLLIAPSAWMAQPVVVPRFSASTHAAGLLGVVKARLPLGLPLAWVERSR